MQQNIDKLNTVIFDMDGVLFDTEKVYLDVWTKVFEKHGYKITKEIYCKVIALDVKMLKRYLKRNLERIYQ